MLDTSIPGKRVAHELGDLIAERGVPKMIVSDNGTELTSNPVLAWSGNVGIEWPHSSLGYATPAAFAAALEKQWAGLNPSIASTALLRDNTNRSLATAG